MPTKAKKRLTPAEFTARVNAEKTMLQNYYCNTFKFWRGCRLKPCRRARACCGDRSSCLKRGVAQIPRDVQFAARQKIQKAAAPNLGRIERDVRGFMPYDICELRVVVPTPPPASRRRRR